jgi:putative tryptophan/tyrosine transport system permease protein
MFVPFDIGLIMGLIFAWAVLALALAFRLFNFPDLTIEGSLPLGASVFAVLLRNHSPLIVCIIGACFAGSMAGALTGFLHVRFKLNKFLTGIIVVAISYSLSLRIMGASNIGLLQSVSLFDSVAPLDNMYGPNIHLGTIVLIGTLITLSSVLLFVIFSSRRGIRLRAAGSNPEFARSIGINVSANIIIGLALTNALAAFSGALLVSYQGFADISLGQGILILALVAMTLGERILPEKKLSYTLFVILAAVFGSIVYQIIVAYAVRLGVAPTDLKLATAILVLLVVAFKFSRNGELFTDGLE